MTIFTLSALLIVGCNATDPTPEVTPENKDFSTIDGKTIKTELFADYQKAENQQPNAKNYFTIGDTVIIYHVPKVNTIVGTKPNLITIKNNTDANLPVKYVALGGNLTAGVRDGGYFNEGIQTSYPNLIARQMQVEFTQPYFDDKDFNGFGRIVPTGNNPTGGPVQKFNIVKNNSGVESVSGNSITLKKYTGAEVDNFAVPYLWKGFLRPKGTLISYINDKSLKKEAVFRVFNQTDAYIGKMINKKPDIVTLEFRTTEILNNLLGGNDIIGQFAKESKVFEPKPYYQEVFGTDLDMTSELELLRFFEDNKIKNGVLLNVPDFTLLPYFNSITSEMIKNSGLGNKLVQRDDIRFLPSSRMDSLLSPKIEITLKILDSSHPLTGRDMVGGYISDFQKSINGFNTEISLFSKRFSYPIVDIKGLYEKVIKGTFITNDGLTVTNKDFFSSDGIYPSALGQACIANEVIKVINNTYKTTIPLINIKEFK